MIQKKTAFLIIDAQYDFCHPGGALFVPGAESDVQRIAQLIGSEGEKMDQIYVTLDTHHAVDIAHPLFWKDALGNTVAPFTWITADVVESGQYIPLHDHVYVLDYLRRLEQNAEFQHIIWPEHCLIGSQGAGLEATVWDAILGWTHRTGRDYKAVVKGLNPLTEHFGVFRAQVPVQHDPDTFLNKAFLAELDTYDLILIAGEARSHCVATSISQILNFAPALIPKVTILTDCMSDVPNLGHLADPIFENARKRGMTFSTSEETSI
jgi:nicotinamidase/pyrazinamidase